MSKDIGAALLAHLAQDVTTMAMCWKITRQDAPTSLTQKRDGSVDNMEIVGFIESDKITEADIMAGKFDYALVDIFIVDWTAFVTYEVS
jgi:hypothetical protein